jgi:mRNA interferase RelE/StbE
MKRLGRVFEIRYAEDFCDKYLKHMPQDCKDRIKIFITKRLAVNPHETGEPLKGTLAGLWRARVGDYKIVYSIQKDQVFILIIKIGHRKNVYDR